jgi:hypothetical protein
MTRQIIFVINKSLTGSLTIVLSMLLTSCSSIPSRAVQPIYEPVIHLENITDKDYALKKNIIVGEHGGYWKYYEKIKETGCSFTIESKVSDGFFLNEWSREEERYPDAKLEQPYESICSVGWTYHSVKGDSSPAMHWNIHFAANGAVDVSGSTFAALGGKAQYTAEALSSAKIMIDTVVLKGKQLNEKVESAAHSLHSKILGINTQHSGILPAGSTSIEFVAELAASVKTKAEAQSGLLCVLPPAESNATSHASVAISSLCFTSFNIVVK